MAHATRGRRRREEERQEHAERVDDGGLVEIDNERLEERLERFDRRLARPAARAAARRRRMLDEDEQLEHVGREDEAALLLAEQRGRAERRRGVVDLKRTDACRQLQRRGARLRADAQPLRLHV